MERKEVAPLEFYTPKQVADQLKISASTLRKYSSMVSKEYGQEYFKRDDTNARIYSPADLDLLKRVFNLKKAPSVSLEKAIKLALTEIMLPEKEADKAPGDTEKQGDNSAAVLPIQDIKNALDKQSAAIASLVAQNQQLMESNRQLADTVQTLLHEIQEAKEKDAPKQSWFSRLFSKK